MEISAPINPSPLESDCGSVEEPQQLAEDPTENEENGIEKGNLDEQTVPYTIPPWSEPPCHRYFLQLLKDGSVIDQFHVYEKGAYMFGQVDLCDFVIDHPTVSRYHAVLQFKRNGDAYLYDLSSTHGTFINKKQVKKNAYVELHVGDMIRFGHSSQLYILQGPSELIQPGLAESLNDLFTSVSTMIKGELQGTGNLLELLEKMNVRVAEEYKGFGDVASGLRVFVEQLKSKSGNFDEYVTQIDSIEHQVTEFEAVISVLDRYVSLLESKVQSVYKLPTP